MRYQVRVTKDNGEYINFQDNKNREYIEHMFRWYKAHESFFNGVISIEEYEE